MRHIDRIRGNYLADNSFKSDNGFTPLKNAIMKNDIIKFREIVSKYYAWKSIKIKNNDIKDFDNPFKYIHEVTTFADKDLFEEFLDLKPELSDCYVFDFMRFCHVDCEKKFYILKDYLKSSEYFSYNMLPENRRKFSQEIIQENLEFFFVAEPKYDVTKISRFEKIIGSIIINSNMINNLLSDDLVQCDKKLSLLKDLDDNFATDYKHVNPNNSCANVEEYLLTKPEISIV
ncbi:hypothetical protein QLL95_gp0261 [Cotonvirus japonicus]|uniref:Uncharacterized protein n=1 Tax=Cotonvirus japonicus TaxID=2811091 RepID=A0ABM7NRH0_9VIRU|nr:hypothetical protein QLL95_gp0261 [Cotonvirus japonicus]BCS82750.1 hypothetical protein [Cotonvirus japonicus]